MTTKPILKALAAASILALSAGALAPTADAGRAGGRDAKQAWRPVAVHLSTRPAPIRPDGTVKVVMRVRCKAGFNAFEINTSVVQSDAAGSAFEGGPFLLTCDGTLRRHVESVAPDDGYFHRGAADLFVNIQFYDPVNDRDLEATDDASVTLFRVYS